MSNLASDLRHGLRGLARSRAYTAVVVGVLAIGVGASTATFTVVDHVLFRPLDLPDSERLVTLCETHEKTSWCGISPVNAADWAAESRTLAALGVARAGSATLRGADGRARGVAGGIATPGFFRALGIAPQAGRLLAEEDQPPRGEGRAVLVSAEFWRTTLDADPAAVGRTLALDDLRHTVVGVLPEGALVPRFDWVQVWRPLPFDPRDEENRDWRGFVAAGRLAPGATLAEAEAELAALRDATERAHPEPLSGWSVRVRSMRDYLTADVRPVLLLFLAAVGLLLLVVCATLSNVLLSRLAARAGELAVRAALGASRAAIARGLLVESALAAALGGALGLLVAAGGMRLFVALAPPGVPRLDEVALDARAFGFCFAAALLTQLLVAGAAGLQRRRAALADVARLRGGAGSGAGGMRLRRGLVAVEVALSVVLVAGSGLLLRSFDNLASWDPGFPTDRLLLFQTYLSRERYAGPEELRAVYRRLEAALSALPGARAVGTGSAGPVFGGDGAVAVLAGGAGSVEHAPTASWYDVGPSYFSTLGLSVVAGRAFGEREDAGGAPAVMVNETLARRLRPDGRVVGLRVELPELSVDVLDPASPGVRGEILGVVADVPSFEAGRPPEPAIYLPNRQRPRWGTYFLIRTTGEPRGLAPAVAAALASVDPDLAPSNLGSLEDEIALRLKRPRFSASVVGAFALVALLLGMAGVYGVVAYSVSLRRRELGLRVALGARPGDLLRAVLGDGLRLVAIGAALGVAGTLAATRLLRDLLFGVLPADPLALGATALLVGGGALLACAAPALRASRVDPNTALRAE